MARWNVSLPLSFMQMLRIDLAYANDAVVRDEIPAYAKFVKNLLKDGETPSEEFAHAAMGFVGEAAEVSEVAKKAHFYEKPLDPEKLLEELGDARFYYQCLLNQFGITDEMVIGQNIKKLRVRYASGKFSKEQANARADKPQERKFMSDSTPTVREAGKVLEEHSQRVPIAPSQRSQPESACTHEGLIAQNQEAIHRELAKLDPDTVGETL